MSEAIWVVRVQGHGELPVITTLRFSAGYPDEAELLDRLHEAAESSRLTRSVWAEDEGDGSWAIVDADSEDSVGWFFVVREGLE